MWSNNNAVESSKVSKASIKYFEFHCANCNHTFIAKMHDICKRKHPCHFCSDEHRKFCGKETCEHCRKRSFAMHKYSQYLTENNNLQAHEINPKYSINLEFKCPVCSHNFQRSPEDITFNNRWCPYCAHQKLCEDNNCKMCFENSFASSKFAALWHEENEVSPRQEFRRSTHIFRFSCNKCNHDFSEKLDRFATSTYACPICMHKQLCADESCELCFNMSFASTEMAKHWSHKNDLSPREVFRRGSYKAFFSCPKCGVEYRASVTNIAIRGNACRCCANKGEGKLDKFLRENVKHRFVSQAKFEWCKGKRAYPFDYYFPDLKVIVELDGDQHIRNSKLHVWSSLKEVQQRDKFKMHCAIKNGISIIRVTWQNVYNANRNNWKVHLTQAIKRYLKPTTVFIDGRNREYDAYRHVDYTKPIEDTVVRRDLRKPTSKRATTKSPSSSEEDSPNSRVRSSPNANLVLRSNSKRA